MRGPVFPGGQGQRSRESCDHWTCQGGQRHEQGGVGDGKGWEPAEVGDLEFRAEPAEPGGTSLPPPGSRGLSVPEGVVRGPRV